jgi:hypothetical protein
MDALLLYSVDNRVDLNRVTYCCAVPACCNSCKRILVTQCSNMGAPKLRSCSVLMFLFVGLVLAHGKTEPLERTSLCVAVMVNFVFVCCRSVLGQAWQ